MSSHSGGRIQNCSLVEPHCFVFDSKSAWNDAKVDLFYLTVLTDMDVAGAYEETTTERENQQELLSEITTEPEADAGVLLAWPNCIPLVYQPS